MRMENNQRLMVLFGVLALTWGGSLPVRGQAPPPPELRVVIALESGWNLIALPIEPADPAVSSVVSELITRGSFEAIWSWDPLCQCWSSYQGGHPALNARSAGVLSEIHSLKGYWIKVSAAEELSVTGTFPNPNMEFQPGWNLVGFPGIFTGFYEVKITNVFRGFLEPGNEALNQVWRFDAKSQKFKGWDTTAAPTRSDFIHFERGQGYWVYATRWFALSPNTQALIQADTDWPPEDNFPGPEDWDFNGDGYFDGFETQDSMNFDPGSEMSSVVLNNQGNGVIDWAVSGSPPWIVFDRPVGSSSSDSDALVVRVKRDGLVPGSYQTVFWVVTSVGSFPVNVGMEVPEIDGDYEGQVKIEQVNHKTADLPAPHLYLSLFRDSMSHLRAVIDGEKSLTFPSDINLSGRYLEPGTSNRFILSGGVQYGAGEVITVSGNTLVKTPAADPNNPLPFSITREITLVGDRVRWNQLQGTYYETITGALPQPIVLEGEFSLSLNWEPTENQQEKRASHKPIQEFKPAPGSLPLPVNGGLITSQITVSDRIFLDGVEVKVNIEHPQAQELSVWLISPQGTRVNLHLNQAGVNLITTYDTYTLPADGDTALDRYLGEIGQGTWTLYVQDQAGGQSGKLMEWVLYLDGVALYRLTGQVEFEGGAPAVGAQISLAGGGDVASAIADAGGNYYFDFLFPGSYQVTASVYGYQPGSTVVWLSGGQAAPTLTLAPVTSPTPSFLAGPRFGNTPLTVSFTGVSIPGGCNNLTYDFGDGDSVTTSSAGEIVQHVYTTPGVYTAGMSHCSIPSTTTHVISVGPAQAVDGTTVYSIGQSAFSGGGIFEPGFPIRGYFADSANFSIDRPPLGNLPPGGNEDSLYSNTEKPYRIFVNIGSALVGRSSSQGMVLEIGPNTNR